MHPALSVILFTTAAGAGYGLLAVLALGGLIGRVPAEPWLGGLGLGLALALVTGGLLASTRHLGRPERALLAFTQWRSSWLSREAVLAAATYLPALALAWGWVLAGQIWAPAALLALLGALATIVATAMIYASLKTVARWHSPWVPACYLAFALATGLLWAAALVPAFAPPASHGLTFLAALAVAAAWLLKLGYWRATDPVPVASDLASATGLGRLGAVRPLDPPHTETNYLLDEMGYRVARKHAARLRRIALLAGGAAPLLLLGAALALPPVPALVLRLLAAASGTLGVLVERWLFFAEARHTVALYYGNWRP